MKSLSFRKDLIGVQEELLRFAYKLTADREEANDLLQETSLKALDNEEKYVPDTNFKGWMYTIMRNNADYKAYMTYLNYAPEIQSMIYTTNWIERLNRDFRRVTRMRTAMPNEESVLTLMGSVAMEHKAFDRLLPNITCDKTLFPD